ncbi:ferrous iron transporter B [bacterium]|nr:ferrous iron transporter B [bacterium]
MNVNPNRKAKPSVSEANIAKYDGKIESALGQIAGHLYGDYHISKRMIGILLLQDDAEIHELVREKEGREYKAIQSVISEAKSNYSHSLSYLITMSRQSQVAQLLDDVISISEKRDAGFAEKLSRLMINPLVGIPLLLIVLWGIYYSVGVWGAGFLVDWLEGTFFGDAESGWILPSVTKFFEKIIPWELLQDLFVHEYGIITLGFRYAIAIVLPVVGIFFIVFSIIEDSGYLPRLAMLIDGVLKKIGLNGRAVIPLVLGLGCDTMATVVTRTLETKRERVISTFLLALAVPCAAQQAVFIGILSRNITTLIIWVGVVVGELLLVGYLSSKVLPGPKPSFYMELPPLRLPKLTNILTKTYSRMQWYFLEIMPLFIIASVLIWVGRLTKLFDLLIKLLQPIVNFIGLPNNVAEAILYGFFRRDYAAAALYDEATGAVGLTGNQFLIAAVVLTLFLPCIAQFLVMIKERGLKTTMAMIGIILVLAFSTGFLLNTILNVLSVQLSL